MDYGLVLSSKFQGQSFSVGDTYDSIISLDGSKIPSKAALEKLWPTVVAEIEAEKEAKEARKLSAIGKLEALGLTVDEVRDVFGIEV